AEAARRAVRRRARAPAAALRRGLGARRAEERARRAAAARGRRLRALASGQLRDDPRARGPRGALRHDRGAARRARGRGTRAPTPQGGGGVARVRVVDDVWIGFAVLNSAEDADCGVSVIVGVAQSNSEFAGRVEEAFADHWLDLVELRHVASILWFADRE